MFKLLKKIWSIITNPAKLLANISNEPYFKATITLSEDQTTNIDVDFNSIFVYELDELYRGNAVYAKAETNDDKMAVFLYDVATGIFMNNFPERPDDIEEPEIGPDPLADIPPLAFRGGSEVKQVVDLANFGDDRNKVDVDVELG